MKSATIHLDGTYANLILICESTTEGGGGFTL